MDKIRLNDDSVFFPDITRYEDDDQVDRVYICGETGCGKSTYIKQYVQHFLAQYPKGTVLLFSSKQQIARWYQANKTGQNRAIRQMVNGAAMADQMKEKIENRRSCQR